MYMCEKLLLTLWLIQFHDELTSIEYVMISV